VTAKSFGRWDAKEMAFVHGEGKDARIIWTAEDGSYEACELLNAAVRKYAADAIREAADALKASATPNVGVGLLEAKRQMTAFADRFERGDA